MRPAPGIRGRRHEAARRTLEKHGWKLRRVDAVERSRHYTHEAQEHALMVAVGGTLYWTEGHGSLARSEARAGDAAGDRRSDRGRAPRPLKRRTGMPGDKKQEARPSGNAILDRLLHATPDDRRNGAWRRTLRNDPCALCGGPGRGIDHIVPSVDGGADTWENLTGCCNVCNNAKGRTGLLQHLHGRPRGRPCISPVVRWLDGLRLATVQLHGKRLQTWRTHGPAEGVLDRLLQRHPEADGALVYYKGNGRRNTRYCIRFP